MIKNICPITIAFCLAAMCTGCAAYEVIPERLENQVNHKLQFADVRDHPEEHKGEFMVLGGEVLSSKRLEDQTKLVILQIPLDEDMVPAGRRSLTEGRFVALSMDNFDPAVFEQPTAVTLVGEILGSETIQVDQDKKTVPVYAIKDLTIWDEERYWRTQGYGYPTAFHSGYRPIAYPFY